MEALDSEAISALDCAELSGNEGLCRWMLENLPKPQEELSDDDDLLDHELGADLKEQAQQVLK